MKMIHSKNETEMNPVGRGMQNENHRMKVDSFCDFHFHSENENENAVK